MKWKWEDQSVQVTHQTHCARHAASFHSRHTYPPSSPLPPPCTLAPLLQQATASVLITSNIFVNCTIHEMRWRVEGGRVDVGGACFVCVFTLNHSSLNASLRRLSVGICPPKLHVFFPVGEFSCHPHMRALTWRRLPFWRYKQVLPSGQYSGAFHKRHIVKHSRIYTL